MAAVGVVNKKNPLVGGRLTLALVSEREAVGSCSLKRDGYFLFDGNGEGVRVSRDGESIFAQAFQVAYYCLFCHYPGFLQGVAFRNKARQGGTGDNVSSFLSGLEEHRKVIFVLWS